MTELNRIADQMKRALEGPAWSGPSLMETLHDVSAAQAAEKLAGTHSIWEIVLHIDAWKTIVRRRIEGELLPDPAPHEDWPPVSETSPEAWALLMEQMAINNRLLQSTVVELSEERLWDTVPGKDYSLYVMLHGSVQHALYHGGQIAVLKRIVQTQSTSPLVA